MISTVTHHSFADDLQLQMSTQISELLHSMQSSVGDVKALVTANMLKFNDNKSELAQIFYQGEQTSVIVCHQQVNGVL